MKIVKLLQTKIEKVFQNPTDESWKALIIRILLIVLVYVFIDRFLMKITTMSFERYYGEILLIEFFNESFQRVFPVVTLIIAIVALNKKLLIKWTTIEFGQTVRVIIFVLCILLAWIFSSYDYNAYFGQPHHIDRGILIIAALLVYWRPIFSFVFSIQLLLIIGQFEVLPGYSLAVQILPIRIIFLFQSMLFLTFFGRKFKVQDFIFMMGCLIASNYFISGLGKMSIEWLTNDQIGYILPATYANGWLFFYDAVTISEITKILIWLNIPLKLFVIIVECGFLLFYYKKQWSKILLIGTVLLHLGIFAFSGIFFYLWITILILIFVLFIRKGKLEISILFGTRYFLISILLIGGGILWCRPVKLAWNDVPISYTYKFHVEDASGKIETFTPDYFSPYDYQFTTGNFKFLNPEPRLPIVWGASNAETSKFFIEDRSLNEILEYERSHGSVYYNQKKKVDFMNFIHEFLVNNNKNDKTFLWSYVQSPRLLLTYPLKDPKKVQQDFKKVIIYEELNYYSKEKGYMNVRTNEIYSFPINSQ